MRSLAIVVSLAAVLAQGVLAEAAPMDFGAAWYPEAWPKARWAEDVRLMKEAGFAYVRIGEFNWYGFEPREGEFRFGDFREVLDLLQANGLKAILCTPTAAPPRWLMAKYPNAVKTYASGRPEPPEMRRQYCYNDPDFRRLARRITEKMAAAYKGHPAILAWQVDNELSSDAEGGHCRCARCTEGFRAWLKAKYGTTDRLNAAWNAAFYLAANVDLASGKRLWRKVLARAALEPIGDWPDDVARVKRGTVVVYTNVREEPVTFPTSDAGEPLLGPVPKGGQLTLPAYGVSVFKTADVRTVTPAREVKFQGRRWGTTP